MKNSLILITFFILLSGCAAGNKINYHEGESGFTTNYNPTKSLAVVVQDNRPYVLSGDKSNTFVGLTRSLYGIPYDTATTSGKPLHEDLTHLIARTIAKYSPNTKPLIISKELNVKQIAEQSGSVDNVLLFNVTEWKSDLSGVGNGLLHHNVLLEILDKNGTVLASRRETGKEPFDAKSPLNVAITKVLNNIVNDKSIVKSIDGDIEPMIIKSTANPKPIEKPREEKCSVEQILEMQKLEISEDQIKAACE